ncbi:MAG: hypothetical protein QGG53_15570, partial [Planctomycetota bacterium]|nr:hypothetical protein [Planctomycetota bacterium]
MPSRLFALLVSAVLCSTQSNAESDAGRMTRYYAKHGVQAAAIQTLLDMECGNSAVRKFASRGLKAGRGGLP